MIRKITLFAAVLVLIGILLNAFFHLTDVKINILALQNFLNEPEVLFNRWKMPYFWGILCITLCLLAIVRWQTVKSSHPVMVSIITVTTLTGLQIFMGIWSIQTEGMPLAITFQALFGMMSFWILFRLYLHSQPLIQQKIRVPVGYLAIAASGLLLVQIFLGLWASTQTSSLMCNDFPRCNGQWIPDADFLSAVYFSKDIFNDYFTGLSYNAQLATHWIHRVGGGITFVLLVLLMLKATSDTQTRAVRKSGLWLSFLLLIELSLGTFSIKLGLPLWIMMAHHLFAALLMLPLIAISFYSRHEQIDAEPTPHEIEDSARDDALPDPQSVVHTDKLFLRLSSQLKKTRHSLGGILTQLPLGKTGLSDALLDDIEARLLLADIGIDLTTKIIHQLTEELDTHQLKDSEALLTALKHDLLTILKPCHQPLVIPQQDTPFVILVVGVNGAGKTTTIGKLAKKLQHQGHSVMLAAGDTFRAAAVEQLHVWGERNEVQVVAQQTGADSASVIFDALQSAKAKGIDVLIADTAGRLHTKANLMDELAKIKRIMGKIDPNAPHEVLLILDAGTGQNALSQAKLFNETVTLTGLTLTKLDGTAKGGVIFALAKQLQIPIRHIGIGESIDDLQDFNAQYFVDALFATD